MLNIFTGLLLLISGLIFTMLLRGLQFRRTGMICKHIFSLFGKREHEKGALSPFQALSTALAGSVGTGNIAGVAGALIIGGRGAIFWMWISALLGMATKYAEIVLAMRYRSVAPDGVYSGSTMDVILNGIGRGKAAYALAYSFAILGMTASFASGNMVQISTIASAVNSLTAQPCNIWVGIIGAALTALILFGGVERIGKATGVLVPFMSILYIAAALLVIIPNISRIPNEFCLIVRSAFGDPRAALGGAAGFTMTRAFRVGVMRGIFSNEAGIGSAPMAHACAPRGTHPVEQGMVGMFEVFFDTIFVCSLTAFTLLLSGVIIPCGESEAHSVAVVIDAFSTVFSYNLSSIFVASCTVLFAFSSILGWSLYGMKCSSFIFGAKSLPIYKIIFPACLIIGATMDNTAVWRLGETANGAMGIPNLLALAILAPVVKKLTVCYTEKYDEQNKWKHKRYKKHRT